MTIQREDLYRAVMVSQEQKERDRETVLELDKSLYALCANHPGGLAASMTALIGVLGQVFGETIIAAMLGSNSPTATRRMARDGAALLSEQIHARIIIELEAAEAVAEHAARGAGRASN